MRDAPLALPPLAIENRGTEIGCPAPHGDGLARERLIDRS
jgi:hypothetical protein